MGAAHSAKGSGFSRMTNGGHSRTNMDFLAHTATSRDKKWDVMLYPKKVGRIVLKEAGDIEYYCRFHPNMIGRISVSQ